MAAMVWPIYAYRAETVKGYAGADKMAELNKILGYVETGAKIVGEVLPIVLAVI